MPRKKNEQNKEKTVSAKITFNSYVKIGTLKILIAEKKQTLAKVEDIIDDAINIAFETLKKKYSE